MWIVKFYSIYYLTLWYIMAKKGFYIKKSKVDQSIYLNIFIEDFGNYIKDLDTNKGWVKFRIYEREQPDDKFTHNMELIHNTASE